MIPIIGNILQNTIGKVIGGVVNKYLPASMSDKEKADMELEIQKLLMEENKNIQAQMETINKTMQEEAKSEHWITYSWRPILGYTFAAVVVNNYILYGYLAQYGVQQIDIPVELWGAILVILGAASALRGYKQVKEASK